ncbi:hypothetical protein ECANGB1_1605 [Enterospora canceri]|uniref:Uncharacterized protein n=1 Tax=Enterospora canceri TaxID=1081671 RepID=A0A1Y1S5N0_9MICR|nr:hypothetical protein ECANGB1_1605 [Enterospora canceri]
MKQEWEDEVSRTSFIERKKLEPIERQIAQHEDGSVEEDDHEFTKMVEQIEKCGNDGMRVGCTNNAMVDFDHKAFDYLVLLDQTSDKIGKNGKNGKDERMGILSRIFCCGEESTEDEKRMNLILFRKRKGSPKRMVANTKNIRVVVE